jgi:hypothetical protein
MMLSGPELAIGACCEHALNRSLELLGCEFTARLLLFHMSKEPIGGCADTEHAMIAARSQTADRRAELT